MPRPYTNLIWPSNDRIDQVLCATLTDARIRKKGSHTWRVCERVRKGERKPSFQYSISQHIYRKKKRSDIFVLYRAKRIEKRNTWRDLMLECVIELHHRTSFRNRTINFARRFFFFPRRLLARSLAFQHVFVYCGLK